MPKRRPSYELMRPMISRSNKKPTRHMPWFIFSISIIQVGLFYAVDGERLMDVFGYNPYQKYEVWRFLTVMFVHEYELHLWSNVIMQLLLGVFFEYTHAYKKIASIYILSVIAGALFKTAINTVTNYAGAPSAVLALFLSQFVDYLMNWRALKKWREMKIPFVRICGAMVYIVHSFVLFSVEAAIDDPQVHHHYSDRISHFIGGISGMCLSSLLVKQVHLEDWQTTFQALSALALMILILPLIIIIMLQYPLPPPPPPTIYDDSGPFYLL